MIPILYEKNASSFDNNGIGHLKDAVSCKVTEERNGAYTLTLQYPTVGSWYENITEGSIIKAKANDTSELQLFRICRSSKPMKGIVTFYAEHISYDLKGVPIMSFFMTDTTAEKAMKRAFAEALLPHRFTAQSNIESLNDINITKPRSLRNFCGGEAGSVLSNWRGEFEFDNFVVKLHKDRGSNNSVVINYGKNLTDAKQERNISSCYTHFCPYAIKVTETTDESGEVIESAEETITLPEGLIELIDPEDIGHYKALILDISDKFDHNEDVTADNLRRHANEYIKSHKLGVPDVNITLSFAQIWHSPEYKDFASLERVSLCDTVTVYFENIGINAIAKVIKTEYDSLSERYLKIEVGEARSNLSDTVIDIKGSVKKTRESLTESEKSTQTAIQNATGNNGGNVLLYPTNSPKELLIMDSDKKETAAHIWKWSGAGLEYSGNGNQGPYIPILNMDGKFVGLVKSMDSEGNIIRFGTDSAGVTVEDAQGVVKTALCKDGLCFSSGENSESVKPIVFNHNPVQGYLYHLLGTWYIDRLGSPPAVCADRTESNAVEELSEVYSRVFDRLIPISHKYNGDTSGKLHLGILGQDAEEAAIAEGLSAEDFGAVTYVLDENGNKTNYAIRYEELVALCIHEIQKIKSIVKEKTE